MDKETFFREVMQVEDDLLVNRLAEMADFVHLKKGSFLVKQGDKQEDFFFLVEGIFRGGYLDIHGREVTDCIGFKCGTPGMSAFINNSVSPINIETLPESIFIKMSGKDLAPLIEQYPVLLKIYNNVLQTAMQVQWELKMVVSQRPVTERYQWFLEKYPGLIDRISHKYIASYLGMTPVTFSRIRRAMREK